MAVDLSELLALPAEDRAELAVTLWESVETAELEGLVRELAGCMAQINHSLDAMIACLEGLDQRIERNRAEVRETVLRSQDAWPFALPPAQ